MKSKNLVLWFGLILICHPADIDSQIINHKFDISFQAGLGKFTGKETSTDGLFTYTSFYYGLINNKSLSAEIIYNLGRHFSLGAGVSRINAKDWYNADYLEFDGAKASVISVYSLLQIHTAFHNNGFFNRCKLFIEIAPMTGTSNIALEKALVDIRENETFVAAPVEIKESFFGARGRVGGVWTITQNWALTACYSYQINGINTVITNDTKFAFSQVTAGIVLRLKPDKRFFY